MSQQEIIEFWIEKAKQDLASARDNYAAGRLQNAIRDAYFACFHALTAVLIHSGRSFKRHKEVRSMLHRDYIRTKKIEVSWGKHYDWLFDNRQKADYRPLVHFEADQVEEIIRKSQQFVQEMESFLNRK